MTRKFLVLALLFLFSVAIASAQLDGVLTANGSSVFIDTETNSESIQGIIGELDLSSPKINSFLRQKAQQFIGKEIPLIILTDGRLRSSEKQQIADLGGNLKYTYTLIDGAALSIDSGKLPELAELSFIESIEFDADTKVVLAQSTKQIGADRVWNEFGVEGSGVKIAVLDTGIDNDHPDLQNVVLEQDFTGEGTDDGHGHGTHVASTAAGSGALSAGLNKGVAPKASLIDVKVLDRTGSGKMSDTIAGIQFAVLNGADIISMSLGSQLPCTGIDASSLAADAAVGQGVTVVAAAGNLGPLPGTITSPGCAKDVITVGAVDRLDNVAPFSSRGPTLDGRTKPDVVAPGVLILAAQAGGTYVLMSGTSMATPHVSGVVALILSGKKLSPAQVKEVIMSTALDLNQDANSQGAGRVQAYEAFAKARGTQSQPRSDGDEDENRARKKARDSGSVDEDEEVYESEKNDTEYYVVRGRKLNETETTIYVWINKDSGEIDFIEKISDRVEAFLRNLWLWINTIYYKTLRLLRL